MESSTSNNRLQESKNSGEVEAWTAWRSNRACSWIHALEQQEYVFSTSEFHLKSKRNNWPKIAELRNWIRPVPRWAGLPDCPRSYEILGLRMVYFFGSVMILNKKWLCLIFMFFPLLINIHWKITIFNFQLNLKFFWVAFKFWVSCGKLPSSPSIFPSARSLGLFCFVDQKIPKIQPQLKLNCFFLVFYKIA